MICTSCDKEIKVKDTYYRYNNSSATLCSEKCVQEAYRGFHDTEEIKRKTTSIIRLK